jgi:septal ring factor EnvC (AmiA/AmiB activator)
MITGKLEQLAHHFAVAYTQRRRIIAAACGAQRQRRTWLLWVLLCATPWAELSAQTEQQQLEAVRASIERLERNMAAKQTERDKRLGDLRAAEKDIAAQHARLAEIRAEQALERQRLAEFESATQAATAALQRESGALARQVRLSYMTGREELLKLVLNQEDPARLGRMVTYYDYYNRLRGARIGAVRGELAELAELTRATARSEATLADLAVAQEAELDGLEAARGRRSAAIAELDTDLERSGRELEALRADEQRLTDLVDELSEILAAFPVNGEEPFAAQQGKLAWPAAGKIVGDYGAPRNGGPLRWNGVLLDAAGGAPVRAVYGGRVAFSDWLPGMGLLLIVDHGDDYLSLYGYNEVLLKASGEWVEPGEVLAQVGNSGGRNGPALYFELRHKGQPVNPHPWMNGAPKQ